MGMPTGYNYFNKKKDWLDGVQSQFIQVHYKVSAKVYLEG